MNNKKQQLGGSLKVKFFKSISETYDQENSLMQSFIFHFKEDPLKKKCSRYSFYNA